MNNNLRIYLVIIFSFIVLITLFPPFEWSASPIKKYDYDIRVRYEFSYELPKYKKYNYLFGKIDETVYNTEHNQNVIYYRALILPELLIEYLLIVLIYGIVYLIFRNKLFKVLQ